MSDTLLKQILDEMQGVNKRLDNMDSEIREIKTNLNEFKTEMYDFKTEMYDFKTDMNKFKTEMYDFKTEMYDFKTNVNERFNKVDVTLERIENNHHEDVIGMLKTIEMKLDTKDNEGLAINRRLHRVEGVVEGLKRQ